MSARGRAMWRILFVVTVSTTSVVVATAPGAAGRPSTRETPVGGATPTCKPEGASPEWLKAMYQGLYFSSPESIEDYSYRPVQELQYGHLPAVRDLVFQNRFRLKDAFVALHAPDLLDADDDLYVGQPETAVEIQGPDGARAALIIEEGTSPDAPRIQVVVPFVCWGHPLSDDEPNFVVPLDDLCQALRAADTRRQCSAKLLRRAKAGLPESLANAPEVPPSVVTTTTTPTTIPGPTLPLPPPGPPPTSDGVCPRVGQPCDPLLPVVDPDCRCVR